MTLSEKIVTLRNQKNMSQGELAEKLNVSRQSVSKWETGASTPDLDKLIAMSELFQVTLDELVKESKELGQEPIDKRDSIVTNITFENVDKVGKMISRIAAGIIFITFAPIYFVLSSLGFDSMGTEGTIFISGYLLLCGLICIFSKKKPVIKIIFVTGAIAVVFALLLVIEYLVRL